MSSENPFEYRHTDDSIVAEETELLDAEARQRIASALLLSAGPCRIVAAVVVCISFALVCTAIPMLLGVVGAIGPVVNCEYGDALGTAFFSGVPIALAVSGFLTASRLLTCSRAIDRACARLTIASLAAAVESQSLFWRQASKTMRIVTILVPVFATCIFFSIRS